MTPLCASTPRSPHVRVSRRRAAAALGALGAGLLALSGCDKPTPVATVTVGENSVHTEAACYDDGGPVPASELRGCLRDRDAKTIKVDPDEIVRFGVDPAIADKKWTILVGGRPLGDPSGKTYREVPGNVFFDTQLGLNGRNATVSVLEGSGKEANGLWSFRFEKDG
ncbi:DUF2771 domain-containing protein [Streptomyces sp. NPDC050560]|uniref:DUF2771 domain-containing protein n=1 Tax=Streptomyces sp. NPDC050560 TaxID=3365630 RepID=UPI00379555B7